MRKRVQIAVAILLVAVVGVIAWRVLRERVPVYHGKRLSVWLKAYRINESIPVEAWKAQGETGLLTMFALIGYWRRIGAWVKEQEPD